MEYEITTLGEYARVQGGYAYKSADFQENGKCPVLKIKNVRFGYVDYQETVFIDESLAKSTGAWKTKEGDILISMTGSGPNAPNSLVGRAARVWKNDPDAWINQRVGRLVIKQEESIHPDILFYLLSLASSQEYLVSNSSGSANQANINGKTIESLPCPKIDYQSSIFIAKVLREFDEKIAINQQINQTLEAIAQAVFKSWFVDFEPTRAKMAALAAGGTEEDATLAAMTAISGKSTDDLATLKTSNAEAYAELHNTASLFPSQFIESELGEIPDGWKPGTVEDVLELAYGKALKKTVRKDGDIPVYGSGGINGSHNEALVGGPGIIIGRKGTVGSIHWENRDFFPIDTVFYVVPKNGFSLSYSYQLLKIQGLENMNTDAAVPGLNRNNVYRLGVVLPSPEVISAFNKAVELLYDKVSILTEETDTLTQLRDSLLPKLLSGEISVDAVSQTTEAV